MGHRSSVFIYTLENFYFYSQKVWFFYFSFYSRSSRSEFQISLSTLEIRDQNLKFSFYSRNSRTESQISLSTLDIRDQNFKFLFLLSKFKIRILNFSFYCRIYFFDSRQCLVYRKYNFTGLPRIWPQVRSFVGLPLKHIWWSKVARTNHAEGDSGLEKWRIEEQANQRASRCPMCHKNHKMGLN